MTMSNFPLALIFILGAVLLPLLPGRVRSAGFLVIAAAAFYFLLRLETGATLSVSFLNYGLNPVRVDQLSMTFGYVFVIMALLGGIYSYHVKDAIQQVAALLYVGSSLGVVFAGDLFTLLVFWELMAVTSLFLIWARRTPDSRKAGFRYLIVHLVGGSVLMGGIIWHLSATGSLIFNHFNGDVASYLILFAFALNAAVPPLNAWLPDAYPEGTVTGSVFLSAFTTKVAVYALARGFSGLEILMWAGAAMAVYGVVFAFLANDGRRLLSYHIISQVGYMVCGIGIGSEIAVNGASAHAFAHILYKGLLFMGMGTVLYATGRSKMSELGGLLRLMPLTLIFFMVGAFSISGVPLFSGFISKSIIIYAAEIDHQAIIALMLNMASIGTFLSIGLKLPYFVWFGRQKVSEVKPIPIGMNISMALTSLLCIIIGIYPGLLYNLLPFPMDYHPFTVSHLLGALQLLIFTGIAFWLVKPILHAEAATILDTDWFYRRPSRLAYTLFSVGISNLFGMVERIVYGAVRRVVSWSANPPGNTLELVKYFHARSSQTANPSAEPETYSPDRYRLTVEIMILIIAIAFSALFLWSIIF